MRGTMLVVDRRVAATADGSIWENDFATAQIVVHGNEQCDSRLVACGETTLSGNFGNEAAVHAPAPDDVIRRQEIRIGEATRARCYRGVVETKLSAR